MTVLSLTVERDPYTFNLSLTRNISFDAGTRDDERAEMKPLTGNVGGALSSRVIPSPVLVLPRTDLEGWTLGTRRFNPGLNIT